MVARYCILFSICLQLVSSYTNKLFTIVRPDSLSEFQCDVYNVRSLKDIKANINSLKDWQITTKAFKPRNHSFATVRTHVTQVKDPLNVFERVIQQVVYGKKVGNKLKIEDKNKHQSLFEGVDLLAHLPTGRAMRAEMFHNKSSVHLAFTELLHRGHAYLKITRDHMQTAVDAFAIFLAGNLEDIMRLPPTYVLSSHIYNFPTHTVGPRPARHDHLAWSEDPPFTVEEHNTSFLYRSIRKMLSEINNLVARTIAMMRIAREKLATTWYVVKGSTPTDQIPYETLEKFRPLFKYINGKEMARLNLRDKRILSYIGTHPDLSRHQVGVVASKYLQLNPNWTQARYLNVMNNLLCGVPMIFMRRIPKNTYLQLTHQLFYHIRACDPLQRRFYLQMMTRTQALGKSYSWSARDVSRLGLLLAEVDGPSLSAINPEAMAGITSKVMLEMPTESLQYVTEMQLRYIQPKALNILARKLVAHQNHQDLYRSSSAPLYSISTFASYIVLWQLVIEIII